MSLDKSLKSKSALERHRNVLTRPERIEKLKEQDRWDDEAEPFGLPKVAHRKTSAGAKDKAAAKKAEEAAEAAAKEQDTSAS